MQYRKKSVIIEARQIDSLDYDGMCEIVKWCGGVALGEDHNPYVLAVSTPRGEWIAEPGDWVIKDEQGEFYPCPDHIFVATYYEVSTAAA